MKRIHFVLLLFLLSGSLLLSGCSASDAPQLKVSVIDVKHGDCIVLQSPEGQTMMIDTGNGSYNSQSAIGDTLEQLNIQHLDSLILTHPDKDHIGGVSWVLENYDVTAVYTTARSKDTDLYRSVQTAIKQEGSTYLFLSKGDRFQFGSVDVSVLSPYDAEDEKNVNNASLVLQFTYGQNRLLFMGDAEDKIEKALVKEYGDSLRSTFLKLGHHGIDVASSKFLNAVQPKIVVISKDDDSGYEDKKLKKQQAAYENIAQIGSALYRTDLNGTMHFSFFSDGAYTTP